MGRRALFTEGGVQMVIGQFVTGAILAVEFQSHTASDLPKGVAIGLLVVICVYVVGGGGKGGRKGGSEDGCAAASPAHDAGARSLARS